jgi:hypothetical protein
MGPGAQPPRKRGHAAHPPSVSAEAPYRGVLVATSDDTPADAGPPDDLDAAIAALYGGPLDEFVAGRDALARALRSAGRADEAATVRKLAKPKRLAWALDAAVVADRQPFEEVDAAAESLASARSGADVREATNALRTAARSLADVASGRAAAAGGAALDQSELVPAVLAVAADPEALGALRAGRLVDVPSAGAFGAFAAGPGSAPAARPAARTKVKPDAAAEAPPSPPAGGGRARSREAKTAEREVQRAETKANAARTRAEDAADAADRAAAELAAAEDRRRKAQREVEAARERLDAARREARQAAAEAEEAENAVREAQAARSSLE